MTLRADAQAALFGRLRRPRHRVRKTTAEQERVQTSRLSFMQKRFSHDEPVIVQSAVWMVPGSQTI
ncbi:attachment protein (plasmid) [Agrobacterium tumefaciens]|nr:attachment protein [Agrobacterium tumefaciens]